MRLKADKIASL